MFTKTGNEVKSIKSFKKNKKIISSVWYRWWIYQRPSDMLYNFFIIFWRPFSSAGNALNNPAQPLKVEAKEQGNSFKGVF